MKKISVYLALIAIINSSNFEEVYKLRIYFNRPNSDIRREIIRYEEKLNEDSECLEANLAIAILYNALGRNNLDEKGYGSRAYRFLKKYSEVYMDDPVALGQFGTSYALMSKDTINPFKKKKYMEQAIVYFEEAAEGAKGTRDYGELLLQKSSVYIQIPKMHKMTDIGYEGFYELVEMYEEEKLYFLPELLAMIYFRAGEGFIREGRSGEGAELFDRGLALVELYDINTTEARRMKEEFDKLQ